MHACIICIAIHQVKYFMSNLFPKVKKYGRPIGSSNQCHREHLRRIRTRHPRDKGTIGQTDKFVWRPYQDRDSASSRPVTLAKSTSPSTFRPNNEPSITWSSSPQPAATNAHSSACFHDNISTHRSAYRLKGQTLRTKDWQGKALIGPHSHHLHWAIPKTSRNRSYWASSVGTS